MMELEPLRRELHDLLVQDPEAAFSKLKSLLPPSAVRHKDLLLLEARWEELERSVTKGIIASDEADLKRNKIMEGLLDTISDLSADDFKAGSVAPIAATKNKKWLWPVLGGLAVLGVVVLLLLSPKTPGTADPAMTSPTLSSAVPRH
ncbi:MAG: hypothetical protein IPM82_07825 [Saprospiraceae bacterium]|nr:hypothetical protein [Saprospiraceae bacterium]